MFHVEHSSTRRDAKTLARARGGGFPQGRGMFPRGTFDPNRPPKPPRPRRRNAVDQSSSIKMMVRRLGPWAPRTRTRSMSPVRLGAGDEAGPARQVVAVPLGPAGDTHPARRRSSGRPSPGRRGARAGRSAPAPPLARVEASTLPVCATRSLAGGDARRAAFEVVGVVARRRSRTIGKPQRPARGLGQWRACGWRRGPSPPRRRFA